jgi:hypothetical protein
MMMLSKQSARLFLQTPHKSNIMKRTLEESKQRIIEIMEKLNPETDSSWAIFVISHGQKSYVTSIDQHGIHTRDYRAKYSDPEVLKFSLEQAKELVDKNKWADESLGIVNDKGMQLVKGKYDKVWGRGKIK